MSEYHRAARFRGPYVPPPLTEPMTVRSLLGRRFWIGALTLSAFAIWMLGTAGFCLLCSGAQQ